MEDRAGKLLFTKSKLRWSLFLLCLVLAASAIPFEIQIAPERNLQVLDETGQPIAKAIVRQDWDIYSLRLSEEHDLRVDYDGKVFLPRRTVRTSAFSVVLGACRQIGGYGMNAGFGAYEMIGVLAPGYPVKWVKDKKELESGVIRLSSLSSGKVIRDPDQTLNRR